MIQAAINWHDEGRVKWALGCDIDGHDIGNLTGPGEICGSACLARRDCITFAWTAYEGGTCWFKNGGIPRSARAVTCGTITDRNSVRRKYTNNARTIMVSCLINRYSNYFKRNKS